MIRNRRSGPEGFMRLSRRLLCRVIFRKPPRSTKGSAEQLKESHLSQALLQVPSRRRTILAADGAIAFFLNNLFTSAWMLIARRS